MKTERNYYTVLLHTLEEDVSDYLLLHPECYSQNSKYTVTQSVLNKTIAKVIFDFMCIGYELDDLASYEDEELLAYLMAELRMLKDIGLTSFYEKAKKTVDYFEHYRERNVLRSEIKQIVNDVCDKMQLIKPEALDAVNAFCDIAEMDSLDAIKEATEQLLCDLLGFKVESREKVREYLAMAALSILCVIDKVDHLESKDSVKDIQDIARDSSRMAYQQFRLISQMKTTGFLLLGLKFEAL